MTFFINFTYHFNRDSHNRSSILLLGHFAPLSRNWGAFCSDLNLAVDLAMHLMFNHTGVIARDKVLIIRRKILFLSFGICIQIHLAQKYNCEWAWHL